MNIYNNQLTSLQNDVFDNLTQLAVLYLYNNQLTGEIPSELGNLTGLYDAISLQNNQLSGEIPI